MPDSMKYNLRVRVYPSSERARDNRSARPLTFSRSTYDASQALDTFTALQNVAGQRVEILCTGIVEKHFHDVMDLEKFLKTQEAI